MRPPRVFELNRHSPQAKDLAWWIPVSGSPLGGTRLIDYSIKSRRNGLAQNGDAANVPVVAYDNIMGQSLNIENIYQTGVTYPNPGLSGEIVPRTDSFSVSVWARCDAVTGAYAAIAMHDFGSANYWYWLIKASGELNVRLLGSATGIADTLRGGGLVDGIPHNFIFSADRPNDVLRLYVDGIQQGADIDISSVGASVDINDDMYICHPGADTWRWTGLFAEARWYRRALTQADALHMFSPATRWDLYKSILSTIALPSAVNPYGPRIQVI